jgi:hypothetical protein
MVAMKKGHIVMWFGVTLAIFLFSGWMGQHLGSAAARYWYLHKQQAQIKSDGPERAHLESVLSNLNDVQRLLLFSAFNDIDKKLGKKFLLNYIGALEDIEGKSVSPESKPAIDFALGRAYVYAAILDEDANNNEQATQDMISAESLFQSLGWTDYTEATLRTRARHELDRWKSTPRPLEGGR